MLKHNEEKEPLLRVRELKQYFPIRGTFGKTKQFVKAVDGVSFDLYEGETFGLVGESGCGKSTTGRSILRLIEPTDGEVEYKGQNILQLSARDMQPFRKEMQMVFQDPYSSLNPKKRIGKTLEEPLKIHKIGNSNEHTMMIMELMAKLSFQKDQYYRFPHEFSGGQRQRIGLARALTMNPKLIVCDEPVSALDVSIQSQILNIMQDIQQEFGLTYLFISHDLSVVRHIADRIAVMYLGKIVESAPTDVLFSNPQHPYTLALLSAVPISNPEMKRERIKLGGEIPSPINPPTGCTFHTRCPHATDICKKVVPVAKETEAHHTVACHLI